MLIVMGELGFNLGPLLASAGIVGVALGFGAQSLVKDLIAGLFMLLEDQYGVGDTVDLGEATGVVESVGLRITTVRDGRGVLWYIRNGEIVRVGNKSQGWAMVVVDIPIGFVNSEQASAVLRAAALSLAEDPEHATEFLEPPDVLGVEQLTVDGAVIRTIAKTTADGQFPVQRELRRRLTEALESSGISERIAASRMFPRSAAPLRVARVGWITRGRRSWRERPDLRERRIGGCRSCPNSRLATPYALATARSIGQNPGEAPQLQCYVPLSDPPGGAPDRSPLLRRPVGGRWRTGVRRPTRRTSGGRPGHSRGGHGRPSGGLP